MSPPSKGPRRPKKCINCKTPITQNKHGGIRLFCETCGRPARLMAEKRAKVPDERPTECRDCGTPIEQPRRGVRICCTDCGRKRDMEYQADYHKTWREKHPEKVAGYNEARRRRVGMLPWPEAVAMRGRRTDELAPQILALLAEELSYKQAAERLGITKNAAVGIVDRYYKRKGERPRRTA